MIFYVQLNFDDVKRILFAVEKLRGRVELLTIDIAYFMSQDYKNMLISNILSEKFAGGYARLSKEYAKWKVENFATTKFWSLKFDLVNAITSWRDKKGWTTGIPPNAMDSGGKSMFYEAAASRNIGVYARSLEYGWNLRGIRRGKVPPRPVFRPTLVEYRASSKLTGRLHYAITKMRQTWR